MNINTKYNIGDLVYTVIEKDAYRKIACKCCKATGKVLIDGNDYTCPKCDGNSSHKVCSGRRFLVWESGVVGKITTEHEVNTDSNSNMFTVDVNNGIGAEIKYMIDSTGIGSGTLWNEDRLFPSREEASAFCDVENSKRSKAQVSQ